MGTTLDMVRMLKDKLPTKFRVEDVRRAAQEDSSDTMNMVLLTEASRYNALFGVMDASLERLERALEGHEAMDEFLENFSHDIDSRVVPRAWKDASYLSAASLLKWVQDLDA